jgi:hypothetical protein
MRTFRSPRRLHPGAAMLLAAFLLALATAAPAQVVVVNEYMSANTATRRDADGAWSDWIELYNPGAAAVDLTGCWLSDDAALPLKWQFPQGSVPAHGWLLVWASDKNKVTAGGELHANFKLSSSGEPVLLTAANGVTRLDTAPAAALASDQSYGRVGDGGGSWAVFPVSTPAAANGAPTSIVPLPQFSANAGYHAAAFLLELATTDPAAQIRYTLDGSEPTATSSLYATPLTIDDRAGDPAVYALIPTNFYAGGHDAWRPPVGDIDKITVVRARAFRAGLTPSAVATRSFIVGADVASRCFFPVISLVTDPVNLFSDSVGIYVPGNLYDPGIAWSGNYFESGAPWERPVHIELFSGPFSQAGATVLSQDAGVRISGSWTVRLPQKSLKLYAGAQYGDPAFSTQLFPDLPYFEWSRFRVRSSGDDWGYLGFRDLCLHEMFRGRGFDTQAGRPVIQFLDGEYWGLANLRDEYSRYYYERVYGIPDNDVVVLENDAAIDDGPVGSDLPYRAMRDYVAAHDMNDPAAYAHVDSLMDMANYIAYVTTEIYASNTDWPDNNVVMWRKNTAGPVAGAAYGHDGKWRWSLKDMDACFHWADYNTLEGGTTSVDPPAWSTELLRGLLENDGFRRDFINAMADGLNATFRPARLMPIVDDYADLYAPAIPRWYARWGVSTDWQQWVDWLKEFTQDRPPYLYQHYQAQFGLAGTGTVTVNVNDEARGAVRVNTLVIDANTPGLPYPGNPYPWSGAYFRGNAVTLAALPEVGSRFARWAETGETSPTIVVMPGTTTVRRTAVFVEEAYPPAVVQYWHFNDRAPGVFTVATADSTLGHPGSVSFPGSGAGYLDTGAGSTLNGQLGHGGGGGIRANNPSSTRELRITLPMFAWARPELVMTGWRSPGGTREVRLEYATDPVFDNWKPSSDVKTLTVTPTVLTWDLSGIAAATSNNAFRVRLLFNGAPATADTGATYWDNIALWAREAGVSAVPGDPSPARAPRLAAAPNPFNPRTALSFTLPRAGRVMLEIFDIAGRRVKVLASSSLPAGVHELVWDGTDDRGGQVASGAYLGRLVTDDGVARVKMQLVR